jgi:hypothetical protein
MSDNNLHNIFENTACISTNLMIDYLDGKLSEKEKNRVEVHIASCEMCRDEFEGLSLLEDRSKLPLIVAELDDKIDEKVVGSRKKIPLFKNVYKIAAAIVILIASTWFLSIYVESSKNNLDESMVSQAMEEKQEEAPLGEIEADSVVEQENKLIEKKEEKKPTVVDRVEASKSTLTKANEKQLVIADKETTTEEEEIYMEEDISVNGYAASTSDKVIVSENPTIENQKVKKEQGLVQQNFKDKKIEDAKEEVDDEVVEDYAMLEDERRDLKTTRGQKRRNRLFKGKSKKRSEAVLSNTAAIDNFDQAMAEYNKRDYKQAVELFKKSLGTHTNTDEVHFYLAKSYTNIDDTENALFNYNKVIAIVESPYYQEALWNKAQLLMEMNKSKSAINSLNQLKTGKGAYSKKAGEIIDSLNINIQVEEDK